MESDDRDWIEGAINELTTEPDPASTDPIRFFDEDIAELPSFS